MATESSETFANKCLQENFSEDPTAHQDFGISVVEATAELPNIQWSPNLLRRSRRQVPKGTFARSFAGQPNFGTGVVAATTFIPGTLWPLIRRNRSTRSISR